MGLSLEVAKRIGDFERGNNVECGFPPKPELIVECESCGKNTTLSSLTRYSYDHLLLCQSCIDKIDPDYEFIRGSKNGEIKDD